MTQLSVLLLQTQSYNVTGLSPYQLVTVIVFATNGAGTSGPSNTLSGRSSEAGKYTSGT